MSEQEKYEILVASHRHLMFEKRLSDCTEESDDELLNFMNENKAQELPKPEINPHDL